MEPPSERISSVFEWAPTAEDSGIELIRMQPGPPPDSSPGRTLGSPIGIFDPDVRMPPKETWVLAVPGGRLVTDSGLVVVPDGRVLSETAWDVTQLEQSLVARSRLPRPVRLDGTNASLVTLWSENFFHWLLDALPRYAVLERSECAAEARLIVPERLMPFQAETLARLGIGPERQVRYRREHVEADLLFWPSPAAHTGNPLPWTVDWLRARLGPSRAADTTARRLFVSRALARRRRLANEDEAWEIAKRRGFARVYPERLRLAEQIQLFAEAEAVLGPHGAAHTNALFSRRLTLIELFDPAYLNRCNLALAEASGHDYWYLLGGRLPSGDIEAPLDLLEATLDAALP